MLPEAGHGKGGDRGVKADGRAIVGQQFHREPISVAAMAPSEIRNNPGKLVTQLSRRVLQTDPAPQDREAFLEFLAAHNGDTSDSTIRGLLHLMMSTPEYQLT